MLDTIAYGVGIIFIIMYGLLPLLILSKNKMPEQYTFVPIPEDVFILESDDAFKALSLEICANDFKYIVSSTYTQQPTHTRFSVFIHKEKKLSLLLTQISNPNVATILYLEVSQLYDDNTMLGVVNAPMAGAFPKSSRKVIFRFTDVSAVRELVEIAERIIDNYLSSKVAINLPEGRELEMIEKLFNEELFELIAKGYVQDSAQNSLRSFTLKGACLLSWKLLWPIKQIRERRELAFSKKVLSA